VFNPASFNTYDISSCAAGGSHAVTLAEVYSH